jgi:hypothetical protein
MSRKDFILIAETIANLTLAERGSLPSDIQRVMIAEEFADALEGTNPQFKRELFIQAATGVVAPTARKAIRVA